MSPFINIFLLSEIHQRLLQWEGVGSAGYQPSTTSHSGSAGYQPSTTSHSVGNNSQQSSHHSSTGKYIIVVQVNTS